MNEERKPAKLIEVISVSKNGKRAQVTIEGMNGKCITCHIVFNGRDWQTPAHDGRTVDPKTIPNKLRTY